MRRFSGRGQGYVGNMTHPTDEPIDPDVVDGESLANTDVQGQLETEPEEQRNREQAPDPQDVPGGGNDPA